MVEDHRVALVTGANRGTGLEVCRQLATRGHTVLLGSPDPGRAEAAARSLAGNVRAVQLDVPHPQAGGRTDLLRRSAASVSS